MKSRGVSIAAGLSLTALVLAGCSSPSSDTDNGNGDNASGEPIALTFQSLSDQPAAIAATEAIVAEWNEANPDVQVEIVPAGWDGIYDKLITQFNGGAAPDIIHYEAASIVPFARDGYLADLSEYMSEERKKDIPEGILDSVTVDDQVVAYPTELQSYMVFANKTLLEAAGVEIPTGDTMTWDDLQEMAKATTTADVYGLGWGLKSPTAAFMAMAPQFGGTYFEGSGSDATLTIGEGEMALPDLVDTMAHTDKSMLPVGLTQSGGEVLASFYAGQVAMTVQGSYQAANIAKDAPEGFDWIVLPPLEGPEGADQAANPQTLSVNIDSEHIEEAAAFIEFFTEADNLAALNKADALIPATTSGQEALAAEMAGENGWDQILQSGQYMTSAPYLFVDAYAQWKDTVATPAYQKYIAGENNSEQTAAELLSGWDSITK
ncbi:sugar ABC transporter substrate-binding protein [Microbacterium mitrae]|uniref:Sugar ABC transporter substrate-binding protein n=1 Tax=Microbacterium mitrae TaxID=664640 RepID=A0A5C8HMH2_9MICO|nr:sugar ABC transporter substrate-binding protein [Microbacterium mitrae]TXK04636.1 sugar ABC transporter substrate-binding protein [Microbacterium mitrae]